jgi:uncharacterized protein
MTDVVVKVSDIEGRGLFAARAFARGETITQIRHDRVVEAGQPFPDDFVDKFYWVDNLPGGRWLLMNEPERYINASCDPTAYTKFIDGDCFVIAKRDLRAGEEITTDYLICSYDDEPFDCACGTARCRGHNPSSFFELPDAFQREYEPLLHDWFIAEHRAEYEAMCKRLGIQPR